MAAVRATALETRAARGPERGGALARARVYFASGPGRALQTTLGLLWVLDGALQFQSFMYSRGFVELLAGNAGTQPIWLARTISWAAQFIGPRLTVFNTLAALTQVAIGAGLLSRRSVKPALVLSFLWALVVWWVGEGFGELFTNAANPLTGAPGAVVLYLLIGLLAWPSQRPTGLLTLGAARAMWAVLWLVSAWLWLLGPNSSPGATHDAIGTAPSGAAWLASIQHAVADAAGRNGLVIATCLALASAAIGIAVGVNWHARVFLLGAIVLNAAYWLVGQGLGGMLTGSATDPNAGPLFIVLACALWPLAGAPPGPGRLRVQPAAGAHWRPPPQLPSQVPA